MYRSTIQTLTTIFLAIFTTVASNGQMIIYEFNFDEGLDGWTTMGISSDDPAKADSAIFVWAPNGDAGTGAFNSGQTPIASRSGGGALLFDSDGLDNGGSPTNFGGGPAPAPQKGEIVSPVLDFTGQPRVILAFNQYHRYFSKTATDFITPATSLEVSNDGGTTWNTFVLNDDISPNEATRTNDIFWIDISDLAGNQANVQVKFVWDGNYYFWLIDDVTFYDSLGINLSILDFTNIYNYETPDFAMNGDSFDLEVMIANNGDGDITDSIMFLARVLNENLDLVFSDTGWVEGLPLGDTVIWDFDRNWTPTDVTQQGYFLAYTVRYRGDSLAEMVAPDDNGNFRFFDVRDFSFRKVPISGRAQGIKPTTSNGDDLEYDIANYFSLPQSMTENLKLEQIVFTVCENEDPVVGKNVIGFVVQLPDTAALLGGVLLNGESNLIGLDAAVGLDELIAADQVIGIGSYQFKAGDDASGCASFSIDTVTTLDGDDVLIRPGGQYLVGLRFNVSSQDLFIGTNEDYKIWHISTIVSTPGDGSPGWGLFTDFQENAADIGMELGLLTAVDEKPLPENSVKMFPNPASEFVQVEVQFERPTDATIFLADMTGRILNMRPLKNISNEIVKMDLSNYPSGTYVIRLATREGTKTEHIVVTK